MTSRGTNSRVLIFKRMNPTGFSYRILVVDDEQVILETSSLILQNKGYEVGTARDGFEALAQLRRSLPDLIISDLRMPNMSGFELLSVVRRRFPQIPVIAISGEYDGSPDGLIADAFFSKAQYSPNQLFAKISELIGQGPIRPHIARPDKAPVWVPRNDNGYFIVTCTECLRSFSVPEEEADSELHKTTCVFCNAEIRYLADRVVAKRHKGRAG
jgi:CheY-like chemotaxis protein